MNVENRKWFEEDFITIESPADSPYLTVCWSGFLSRAQVHEGCEQVLKAIGSSGLSCIFNDSYRVRGDWLHSVEWVALDWFPRAEQAGLRYLAWLYSRERWANVPIDTAIVFGEISFGRPAESLGVKLFDDKVQALTWLNKVGNTISGNS